MRRLLLAICLAIPLPAFAQEPAHPLDGLSVAEHWAIYETLRDSGHLNGVPEYLYVGLDEPTKTEVLAWSPGDGFGRRAKVHLVEDATGYEAVVDVRNRRVLEFRKATGRQYMLSLAEGGKAKKSALAHPDMIAGLKARGITDLEMVTCFPTATGFFDTAEEQGRRLARVTCSDRVGTISGLGTPVKNLVAIVDLKTSDVVRVIDLGAPPDATPVGEHHLEAIGKTRPPLPPLVVSQPAGAGYVLDGHEVSWEGWRFHFRVDQRRGLVLSRIRHDTGTEERSVLYQASLSELFVPYQDPDEPWNHQAYFDLGTYPSVFGGVASAMAPGEDCPSHATYFDAYVVTPNGSPTQTPRVACLFERPGAEPAWRHSRGLVVESRARRDLVLRMIMGAGNYDYLFDWVFKQDGSIRVNLAATGIDQMKAVAHRSAAEDDDQSPDDRYGRFVAPYTVAVNHSHFFNFRLDFDIDGIDNSLAVDRLVTERLVDNPRRSVWRIDTEIAQREADAMRTSTLSEPELWRVVNASRLGATGYPSAYLLEGHGARTLLMPDDYLQERAGFTDHTLWVTPMNPAELFAAGDYTTGSEAGAGLPVWTSANRSVADTDIVLWYTIGFHHVARQEDWPILPLELHGFNLKPAGFFERNPSIDLPR